MTLFYKEIIIFIDITMTHTQKLRFEDLSNPLKIAIIFGWFFGVRVILSIIMVFSILYGFTQGVTQ